MSAGETARRELGAGRYDKAKAVLAAALRRTPNDPDLNNLMSVTLIRSGAPAMALHYARRSAHLAPRHLGVQINLAHCLSMVEQFEESCELLGRLAAEHPDQRAVAVARAESLVAARRYGEAVAYVRGFASRHAMGEDLGVPLGAALLHVGRASEAIEVYDALLAKDPDHPMVLTRRASAMLYAHGKEPGAILAAHRSCAANIERHCPPPVSLLPRATDARLRVGFLSPDLRAHSVAAFMGEWVSRLDRDRFEVLAFSDTHAEDAVSRRMQASFDRWRNVAALDNAALGESLRAERLDVLIDLAGYTNARRLALVHLHPARWVVSYLGYPATLGFASVDARLVDDHTDPAGSEAWHAETLMRLPGCFLCWEPPLDLPDAGRVGSEGIVFGSFNAVQKYTPAMIQAWSDIVRRVPGSRLRLKASGLHEEALREDLRARLVAAGLEPERIEFMAFTKTPREHLEAYRGVDVALDTFPYCGTTTTCEALAMGVPVVSLVGTMHHERVGRSILGSVGLESLAATSTEEYVQVAAILAGDVQHRTTLRGSLRATLMASRLCDADEFARAFGRAIQTLCGEMAP